MASSAISAEIYRNINELIADYAWAYDSRDFVAMSETFVPDGMFYIAGGEYPGRNRFG